MIKQSRVNERVECELEKMDDPGGKVQQVLAAPGVLERFVSSPEDAASMRRVFAGLYALARCFVPFQFAVHTRQRGLSL